MLFVGYRNWQREPQHKCLGPVTNSFSVCV